MTNKPSPEDESEADRRFTETLGRLVNTPHKPHKPAEAPPRPEKSKTA
jgi:hypothetical protein